MSIQSTYALWRQRADASLQPELSHMTEAQIEDAFYRDLAFGTGGLRGVLGAGTNRMNLHTVARASQGLADYVTAHYAPEARSIAISYDSRILSREFARAAAEVFAGNGITAHIYSELMPTPCLSFAVRRLKTAAGIMVTASHNPAKYNGYKVYGPDGCQITADAADEILSRIMATDTFDGVKSIPYEEGLAAGLIRVIPDAVYTAFTEAVKGQSLLRGADVDKGVAIVYSPLNGTGLKPVTRALSEAGFTNVTVVEEQREPDGHFPTCPFPNPEIREAMQLGLEYAKRLNADLLLATDPDCDRCGIAVRDGDDYRLLTGNETGMLLLDYICARRIALGEMPERPVFVKTIVTSDMAQDVAASYGAETVNVLTGFKYIGDVIASLEREGREGDYILGFEESYGYLSGTYVRDKDAVDAALLICEMFAWHKAQGVSLLERLNQLYARFGYRLNTLHSFTFEGSAGFARMQAIMADFRRGLDRVAGRRVVRTEDYAEGLNGLPRSDVMKFFMEDGSSIVVRPSGTEPKLKLYISVKAEDEAEARAVEEEMAKAMEAAINN